jgi:curved DNA-binding protein CbpA
MAAPPKREPPKAKPDPAAQLRVPAGEKAPIEIDESLLDETLDIDTDVQRKILRVEAGLDRSYCEILDVEQDANAKEVKRAYFKLSKEFHPDRYFRREIGGYGARLDRIFKKVLEAHEIMSDPELRAELLQSVIPDAPAESQDEAPEGSAKEPAATRRPVTKLERLRQRMPFKIPQRVVQERRDKADSFYRAALQSQKMGRLIEASSSMKIAISFDPYNASYRTELVELQASIAEQRAREILEESAGSALVDERELKSILKSLEDVLLYRPHDPELNHRAAGICVELGEHEKAHEYAQMAVGHSPDVAAYHAMLGRAFRAQGDMGHARKELELAIEIDPGDSDARKALASLRLGNRSAGQGG